MVFSYLSERDLVASIQVLHCWLLTQLSFLAKTLLKVCRYWKKLLDTEDFWKNLYEVRVGRVNRLVPCICSLVSTLFIASTESSLAQN